MCFINKGALRKFAKSTEKHLCQSLILIKLFKVLLKRDSGTGFFLWILQNLQEHLFTEHLRMTAFGNWSYPRTFTVFPLISAGYQISAPL